MDNQSSTKGEYESNSRVDHWEKVYDTRPVESTSWFQVIPDVSLRLIDRALPTRDSAIIDVGGGASTLVDHLVRAGFRDVSVLDVSATALRIAQERLEDPVLGIHWIEDDDATGAVAEVYSAWLARNPGRDGMPEIYKCFSHRPDFLQHIIDFAEGVHFCDGHLTRRIKEMIATYVSALNACRY